MSLDPLSTAFAFVQSTTERVSKAISHKEDGKKMLELAKKTETLLLHVSQQDERKSASQGALKDIAEALEFVDKAVAGCCSRSALLTELLASRDHRKLTEAAKKLECSLAALSLNDMKACPEMRRHFSALMADLRTVEFAQTASYFRPSDLMRTEMERIFSREGGRRIAESIPFEMNNALEEHSRSVAQRLHELESLRSQLLLAGPKERDEAKKKYDEQMTVEVIFQYLRTLPVKSIDEFQCQLCCPLGKSFMKDPVLLRDSGMTYDRCQIEHWLARGHRMDPVTRQDLVSAELIPNIAIKELVNIFLTADARELSSKKTRETQSLVAGLYEGRGRYIKGDGSMNPVFAVLLLEPDGNVQGYLLSELPDFGSADDERLIFKGMWNTNTNDLSFDDSHLSNKGSISYKTDSCQLAFDLEGKALPRDQCSSAQEEIAFTICHVTRSPILHHCRIHPGILEMEGVIALGEGQELENSLVLIFEKDLSVRGWMAFKEDDSHTASRYGHVLSGNWNTAGEVHLEIYFLESKTVPLKSEREPMRFLAKFKLNGILYERTDEARAKGPVFQGELEGSTMGSFDPPLSRTVPTLNIPAGVRVHFSYVHFRAPSRCLSSTTMQRQMKLLRLNSEPERRVCPGLVEIKFKHRLYLVETALSLGVCSFCDDDVRDNQSFCCQWTQVPRAAAIWELQSTGLQNQFHIKMHTHITNELSETCGYLSVLPRTDLDTERCEDCNNTVSCIPGKSHACTWKLSYKGTKIVAEVKNHPDDSASHLEGCFLSMPNFKKDSTRNPFSLYVPISKETSQALELEFTYHSKKGLD